MEIWELLVREQVRETFTRYSTAGDGGRLDDLAAQFADDGGLRMPPEDLVVGREAIARELRRGAGAVPPTAFPGQRPFLRHFVTNIHFTTVTPERAETTAYFHVMTGMGTDHWGRYFDVLVPAGDRWLFHRRVAKVEGFTPEGWYARNRPS